MLQQENSQMNNQTDAAREAKVEAMLAELRKNTEGALRQMAERLVDLPDDQLFGQVELDLRDLGHDIAACAHQTGLEVGKKGGM
jgi:hypothetical protein